MRVEGCKGLRKGEHIFGGEVLGKGYGWGFQVDKKGPHQEFYKYKGTNRGHRTLWICYFIKPKMINSITGNHAICKITSSSKDNASPEYFMTTSLSQHVDHY